MPTAVRDPTDAAHRLLADVWRDGLPIDPVRIARSLGIKVLNAVIEDKISGGLVKKKGEDATIVLNSADSANRRRFTCAHELGHYVQRAEAGGEYEYVDYRDMLSTPGTNPEERVANAFAAALLMPEGEVCKLVGKGLTDVQMALRFDVTLEAMRHRLQDLGWS